MEHFFQRQALAATIPLDQGPLAPLLPSNSSSGVAPSRQLGQSLALRHVGKYVHVARALTPLAPTIAFSKIVSTLQVFHLSILPSPCPNSLVDFQPNGHLELSFDFFRSAFIRMSYFLVGDLLVWF
jgi:hypothetical protein